MPSARLTRRLNRVASRLTEGLERVVAEVTEEIGRELVPATPVDTGFARGNWRPSLNAPATVPVTNNDPTGAATIARITTVARQYRVGDTVYITSNIPYIERLNEGSSPQAPAGFVQKSVRAGTARALVRINQTGLI